MRTSSRRAVAGPVLLALGAAELGGRLLAPSADRPEPVPISLGDYFSAAEIERGRRFARPQLALALTRGAVQVAALAAAVAWLRRRSGPPIGEASADGATVASARGPDPAEAGNRVSGVRPVLAGAGAGAGLALAVTAVSMPLAAVSRRRAVAVGLITQSWPGWLADLAKSAAIEAGLAAGAGALVVALRERDPERWWLPAAGGSLLFGATLSALAPVLLDPIFNDFTPLPAGPLRTDVLALARSAQVRVGEVYSVDASRRTTAANAYVTGLGPTKRVVLFDTLLDRYDQDEVRTVVAHELAHVRHRDVARALAYAAVVAGPAARAVARVGDALAPQTRGAGALPALALSATLVGAPTGVLGNRLSRAVERRADAFALHLSGAPEAFVSFERAIALQNVADLDPPRWVRGLLATHPSTAERIGAALAAAAGPGGTTWRSLPG